jgi:hypothetical protein
MSDYKRKICDSTTYYVPGNFYLLNIYFIGSFIDFLLGTNNFNIKIDNECNHNLDLYMVGATMFEFLTSSNWMFNISDLSKLNLKQ